MVRPKNSYENSTDHSTVPCVLESIQQLRPKNGRQAVTIKIFIGRNKNPSNVQIGVGYKAKLWHLGLWSNYLSKSITISQCEVCGKRSTAMAFTGWKGFDMGMDLALCLAKPALLMFLHPLLSLFFSILSGDGVQSSIAFATKVSGLHDM